MSKFAAYRNAYRFFRLERTDEGVLTVVFHTDGGPMVSNPHKNVTWTILALSMRTAEHIAERRRKGEL